MLLMPNKKKIATLIVASAKQPSYVQKLGEESKTGKFELPEDEMSMDAMGLEAAMEDLLKAFESKDAKAMAEAFKTAMELCGSGEEEYKEEAGE
jgi:hypothetical protein